MAEKGFLTKKQENAFADMVDNAIKAKGLVELLDGYAARVAITLIDDKGLDKVEVSKEIKALFGTLADAIIAKDVEKAEDLCAEILNTLSDIPGLDEDAELMLFEGAVKILIGAVRKWLDKQ